MISRKLYIYGIAIGILALGLAAAVTACSSYGTPPAPSTQPPATTPPASGISYANNIQPIFNDACVRCHKGTPGPAELSLETGSSYKNIVNVKSSESALMRVSPGAPDKSYIINKLLGTQTQAGGSGAMMPLGGQALPQSQINTIQQWITEGAKDN